jgi:hypothetical protein
MLMSGGSLAVLLLRSNLGTTGGSQQGADAEAPPKVRAPMTSAPEETIVAEPADEAPSSTGLPDTGDVRPRAEYTPAYEEEQRVEPDVYVDLDEPRADQSSGSDIRYSRTDGLQTQNHRAKAASPDVEARDCEEAIQNRPLTRSIPVDVGLTLCVLTNATQGTQDVRPKMVRLTIKSINRDGVLNVSLTAWNVPT